MCKHNKEQRLFSQSYDGLPKGVKTAMFSCVVYKLGNNKYKIESTIEGNIERAVYYKRIGDIPIGIQDKLKQLLWVAPDDQSLSEDLGIRIGDSIFWIV